jgi:hypothetical protein
LPPVSPLELEDDMSGQSTPAGWYPDPQDPSRQRYWDGSAWSEATQAAPGAAPPPTGAYGAPSYGAPTYGAPSYGQPMGYGMAAAGAPPQNYLVFAILTTLFCCLPAGVVSIVKAASVNSKWSAGDYAGAQKASSDAKTWAIISAVVGVVLLIIYFAVIAAGTSTTNDF